MNYKLRLTIEEQNRLSYSIWQATIYNYFDIKAAIQQLNSRNTECTKENIIKRINLNIKKKTK